VTYNFAGERIKQRDVPETHVLARPFTLAAGQVVILGGIEASTMRTPGRVDWLVLPVALTEPTAVAGFREAFPSFAAAPVACLACFSEEDLRKAQAERRKRDAKREPAKHAAPSLDTDLKLTPPKLGH
jgi:hypothetical protein